MIKICRIKGSRETKALLLMLLFLFSGVFVFAQNNNRKIPKGMEAIKIGASGELIVPKGALTRKVGAQIIVEGSKEYMSRRFEEMEERFSSVEKNQTALREEIESLRGIVNSMQKPVNSDQ